MVEAEVEAEASLSSTGNNSSSSSSSTSQPQQPQPQSLPGVSSLTTSAGGRARQDVYLGCGGLTGLFSSLTGTEWGAWAAVAEGNALGKGPLVLHVPQSAVDELRARSAAGSAAFQQAEVDMFRMASLFVVERERPRLMAYLAEALKHRADERGAGRGESLWRRRVAGEGEGRRRRAEAQDGGEEERGRGRRRRRRRGR